MKRILVVALIVLVLSAVAIANKIDDPDFYVSFGNFLLKEGYEQQALEVFNQGLRMHPKNTALLNNLGYYYKELNPLMAEDYFKEALQIDPNYETARKNLALLYNSLGDYQKSVEHFRILVTNYPDNLNYNYDLAINLANNFYYKSSKYEDLAQSIEYFKRVYSKDKNFANALDNLKVLEDIRRVMDNGG